MSKVLILYLITTRRNRYVLFSPTDLLEEFEAGSDDRIRTFINWFMRRRNRVVAWVGRVLQVGHTYYEKLEDRIDPMERVLKSMACAGHLEIYYAPTASAERVRGNYESILWKQRWKHVFWISLDTIACVVIAAFTPFLAPIPGPNVFFYYPFLRWLSHYRAIRGTTSGTRFSAAEFKSLPELSSLEENLRARFDRTVIRSFADRLKARGLEQFLERVN
jgi:hypothetical protein